MLAIRRTGLPPSGLAPMVSHGSISPESGVSSEPLLLAATASYIGEGFDCPALVPRQESAAMSRNAAAVDLDAFRADQDAALDHQTGSAYER